MERKVLNMSDKKTSGHSPEDVYDDDNIPEVDLPRSPKNVEPLPESTRPRKDGPGGDGDDQ